MGALGEWVDRLFLIGILLAGPLLGVWVRLQGWWWSRRPASAARARERLSKRLRQAGVLDASVTPEEERTLLASWLRTQKPLQAAALPATLVGAALGGAVAGIFLASGSAARLALWPTAAAMLAGVLGYACVFVTRSLRPARAADQVESAAPLPTAPRRQRLTLLVGCAAVALCAVVPLLMITAVPPSEPQYGHEGEAAVLRAVPFLLWILPAAMVLAIIFAYRLSRLIGHLPSERFSANPELQRRAAAYRHNGQIVGPTALIAFELPLFASIYLSDLPLRLPSPADEALPFADLVLMGIGFFIWFSALMKQTTFERRL
jgi:hypothetical protein